MTIEIKLANEIDSAQWDRIIDDSAIGTIFHKWKWLRIVEKHLKMKLLPFIISENDNPVGIYPVFLQKRLFFDLAFSPPPRALMLYLGPVIINENKNQDKNEQIHIELQNKMDEIFKKNNVKYIRIKTSPGLYDIRPFKWSGYDTDPLYTYFLDLSDGIEVIWGNLKKKLRQNIRNAEEKGIKIKEGNQENIEDYHNMMKATFEHQGIDIGTDYRELLYDLYRQFYPDNLRIFIAEYENKIVGIQLVTSFKNRISLWTGSPRTDILRGIPNELMQWEIIKRAHGESYKILEIMDAGDDPRFRHFKAKFNPKPQIWYSNEKYSSYIFKIAGIIYKIRRL